MMTPLIYRFKNGICLNKDEPVTETSNSWVYLWVDSTTSKVVYIGEYGKSSTYNLITRLRRSIGELSHNTMNQLIKNSEFTFYDTKSDLEVYCYQLGSKNESERKQIESWCNWMVAVKGQLQHPQYCGFSYQGVSLDTKSVSEAIYKNLLDLLSNSVSGPNK